MRNVDYINMDADSEVEILPNGFLSIMALLTRTGVFSYQQIDPDGTIRVIKQLRTSEEVFSEEHMASLSGLPLTNNHPSEMVTPENASDYIVGMASDTPKRVFAPVQGDSEEYVQQKLTFMDADVIEMIVSKQKTQFSLGYNCELDFTPGVYKGENYDAVQRNIRCNHGSLVTKARGGSNCKVILDDGTEKIFNLDGLSVDDTIINPTEECNVKIFTQGGREYKVEDDVHALLTSLTGNLVETHDAVDVKSKEFEKLTGICDDLKSQIKTQKTTDSEEEFRAKVRARVSLESQATEVLGSEVNLDSLTDREIKVKVVVKLRPEVNLDGFTDAYLDGRFDMSVEDFKSSAKEVSGTTGDKTLGKNVNNQDAADTDVAGKAKAKAWETAKNAWRTK